MVHANELRIGNCLWWHSPNENKPVVITVTGMVDVEGHVHLQTGAHAPLSLDKGFKPISLTDAVLKSCGFHRDEIEYIGALWTLHPVQILDDNGWWLVNDKLRKRLKMHCLHQLQNLYFALTAKELEIDLSAL